MKIILSVVITLTLSSCAFFSKKPDNIAAINKYEKKMRSIATSGNAKLQLPPGYKLYKADLTIVGPDGDVILFYKDGNEIVIKECDRYSIINNRSDCQSNSRPERVSVANFKDKLKSALRVQNFDNLGRQEAQQLKNYREGLSQKPSAEDLVRQRYEAQIKVSRIEDFIEAYGKENVNANELSTLRVRLATLNKEVENRQKFSYAVEALNRSINELVDKVIGNSQMNTMSFSKDKTGVEYSVLRTYLRPYLAQAAFVPVKAATFYMGSPPSEGNREDDEVNHQVTLTEDFEIGVTEVTQLQWVVIMGSNPSFFKEKSHCQDSYMEIDGVSLCSDFPVERVSWGDVKDYIQEYNDRAKDNFTYRLPTEAEWELAARAGTPTAYSSSDLTGHAWFNVNSGDQTRAVATKKPNRLKVYDIYGNVGEWVEDWYGEYPQSSVTNPTGPGSGTVRVMRGGSWRNEARDLRSAYRDFAGPDGRWDYIGFRLVRTPK